MGIQGIENTFCISATASNFAARCCPGRAITTVSTKTAAVTASENVFIASPLSRGKKASTKAPADGRKTIRLSSRT